MAAKKAITKRKSAKKPAAKKPAARKPAARKPAAKKPAAKKASAARSSAAKPKPKAKPKLVGPFQVALHTRIAGGAERTDRISKHRLFAAANDAASRKLNTILRNQKKHPLAGRKVRLLVIDLGTNKHAGESGWHTGLGSPDHRAGPW